MNLRVRNPFYWAENDKNDMVKVVCVHCGSIYHVSYGNVRVDNYCTECK